MSITCPETFLVSVFINTNDPVSLPAEVRFLTGPKWCLALEGRKGSGAGKDLFSAHLFLVVSDTIFFRTERIF